MTVVAFTNPTTQIPPSAHSPWADFLTASLDTAWRASEWDPETLTFLGSLDSPTTDISTCLRDGCGIVVDGARGWCSGCHKARRNLGLDQHLPRRAPNPQWTNRTDTASRFTLARLSALARHELLYGLQERDRQQLAIRPQQVRLLVEKVPHNAQSLLTLTDKSFSGLQRSLLRSVQQAVRRLETTYAGDDGTASDIWDCAVVGLRAGRERPYTAVTGHLDFTVIRQPWLRNIVRDALRALRPPVTDCHRYLQVAAIASSVLTGRPNGNNPESLSGGDMAAI